MCAMYTFRKVLTHIFATYKVKSFVDRTVPLTFMVSRTKTAATLWEVQPVHKLGGLQYNLDGFQQRFTIDTGWKGGTESDLDIMETI